MIRTHGQGKVYHGEDAARTAGDLWRDGDLFIVKTTGASYVRTAGAWVQISVGASTTEHNSLANFDGGTTNEYYHLTAAQHTDLTDGGDTTLHAHDVYIANDLLTTRGDIIVRNATVPERLALTVPSSPTINFLGVANGETQPSWKSASSAGAADAHVVATDASGRASVLLANIGASYIDDAARFNVLNNSTALASNRSYCANIIGFPSWTNSDTNYYIGINSELYPKINSGVTQSGYIQAARFTATRYNPSRDGTDGGALNLMYALNFVFGHETTDDAATTTNAYGVRIGPYAQKGTITNLYGLFIDALATGGTVTNHYAIYQADTTAINFFASDIRVGSGKGYYVDSVKVIGAQGAHVADATGAGDIVAQFNTLLTRLEAHGLLASS